MLELRNVPTTFHIVIGDFGREAASRYVSIVAEEERALLTRILASQRLPFLDEYRRIMIGHVGDVAFLKAPMITREWSSVGHLTDAVLVAVSNHAVPRELIDRLACVIHDEAILALRRGHSRVLVALPCNSLSESLDSAVAVAQDAEALRSAAAAVGYQALPGELGPNVSSHGVVRSAVAQLERLGALDGRPYLVLGAATTRRQYTEIGDVRGMHTVPLSDRAQEVIDSAVLACIGGDQSDISLARERLERAITKPLRRLHPGLAVVEACTDFNFGLGIDSVRLMAQHVVRECYFGMDASRKPPCARMYRVVSAGWSQKGGSSTEGKPAEQ